MLGAKEILIKVKGDNKDFKQSMSGANASMKGFATTTTVSTGTAAASTKAMGLSMASSLALATAGITVLIGGAIALAGAIKDVMGASIEDQEATSKTIALLEQQGIAWDDVGDSVLSYIEDIEALTTIGDTELQTSFNELITSGMSVQEALDGMSAAAAIANGSEMSLSAATKALGKEFTTGTSRLKDYGIEADSYASILGQVTDKMGDGSQASETLSGKWKLLSNELMNNLKPLGEAMIPILTSLMEGLIWGTKTVLPPLIYNLKMMLLPIKGLITYMKILSVVAQAAWEALNGNFTESKRLLNDVIELETAYVNEIKNTILNIEKKTDAIKASGTALRENAEISAEADAAIGTTSASVGTADASETPYTTSSGNIIDPTRSIDYNYKANGNWIGSDGSYVSAEDMGVSDAPTPEPTTFGFDTPYNPVMTSPSLTTSLVKDGNKIAEHGNEQTEQVIKLLEDIKKKSWNTSSSGFGRMTPAPIYARDSGGI